MTLKGQSQNGICFPLNAYFGEAIAMDDEVPDIQ
jgi:hypothetical protein